LFKSSEFTFDQSTGICRYSPKPSHGSEDGGEGESSRNGSTRAWEEALPGDKESYAPRLLKLATRNNNYQYKKGNAVALQKSIAQVQQ
jgi:hypothetical protein